MGRRPASASLWDRLRGRHRILVTNLLLAIVLAVVISNALYVINAIRQSGDESAFPEILGEPSTRLLHLAVLMRYRYWETDFQLALYAVLAAVAVFALAGHGSARSLSLRWRRGVVVTALGATCVGVIIALFEMFLALYALTAVSETMREAQFGMSDRMIIGGMVRPGIEVALGLVVVIVGLAWWPTRAGERGLLDDDEDLSLDDAADASVPTRYASPDTAVRAAPPSAAAAGVSAATPASAASEFARPASEEKEPVVRPRLRPDGSSDSGYDQFRFRG